MRGKRTHKRGFFFGKSVISHGGIRAAVLPAAALLMLVLAGCAGTASQTSEAAPEPTPTPDWIRFSHDSGVYEEEELTVTVTAPEGYTIAYTTDGTFPTAEDDSGKSELEVVIKNEGTGYLIAHRELMLLPDFWRSRLLDDASLPSGQVLRAVTVAPSGNIGETETRTYFPGVDFAGRFPGCLVVSVVIDPEDLLDYETGILAAGAVYDAWRQTERAEELIARDEYWEFQSNSTQRGREWERPCQVQIYDGGDSPAAEENAGIRITGRASRMENQKSFNLYFRDEYGSKYLDYELFEGIDHYRSFRLRAGGNNAEWLKFRDAFLQELVSDRCFAVAASRPAVLFLNGEYWGPYLLTEKVTDQMLHDRFGVDKAKVVLFKEGELAEGKEKDVFLYEELMSYAEKDLTDPETWADFCRIMDIRSMVDCFAARIYFGDDDWRPEKNDVLWRTRDSSYNDGRWQYVLYDVENSSGLYGYLPTAPETDHFRITMERYPLFAAAIRNQEFYEMFLETIREIGSENCAMDRVNSILQTYLDAWEPLMPDYYKRFGDTRSLWDNGLNTMIRFFEIRYDILIPFVESFA